MGVAAAAWPQAALLLCAGQLPWVCGDGVALLNTDNFDRYVESGGMWYVRARLFPTSSRSSVHGGCAVRW